MEVKTAQRLNNPHNPKSFVALNGRGQEMALPSLGSFHGVGTVWCTPQPRDTRYNNVLARVVQQARKESHRDLKETPNQTQYHCCSSETQVSFRCPSHCMSSTLEENYFSKV